MDVKANIKILCVDDEENILSVFRRTIGRQYTLLTAISAEDGLRILQETSDVAVIMSDYKMPGLNGLDFLKLAYELSPKSIQIMLTGSADLEIAINAINQTNIFRYIPKPCPTDILRKVIDDAINQYQLIIDRERLTLELALKNEALSANYLELQNQKNILEHELEMAKSVYSKVYEDLDDKPDGLDYYIAPKEIVGGDFLLFGHSRDEQSFYLMMGDVTGHGLQSALAVLLINEVFDGLCAEKPSIVALAQSINEKMCRKLPTGLFCAALLLKLDAEAGTLQVWQGGLPEVFLLNQQGQVMHRLASNNLPLGVLAQQDYSQSILTYSCEDIYSVFAYSDGVTEQLNPAVMMFGSERLIAAFGNTESNNTRVDTVMSQLHDFQADQTQSDDISLMELKLEQVCQQLRGVSAKMAPAAIT